VTRNPVTVTTPEITVRAGQVIHISGWVRVVSTISGSLDGAMLYDSQNGPVGALRWHERSGWRRFVMVREVQYSGKLNLTMTLTGLGEIQFDDLRVTPHTPRLKSETENDLNLADERNSRSKRFWNRIPGMRRRAPRR
jgi:hypothetical protein